MITRRLRNLSVRTTEAVVTQPAKKRAPRKRKWIWLATGLVALAALSAWIGLRKGKSPGDEKPTYNVTRKSISHSLNLAGKIVPVHSTVITPRQSGRIVEIRVQEGSQVKAGDVLFTMKLEATGHTELLAKRAEVRRLEHEVRSQTQRLEERQPVRELLGSAAVVKEENDLAKLKLDLSAARERLAVIETDLGLAEDQAKTETAANETTKAGIVFVSAPTTGIVTLIDKRPGDFVIGGIGGDASSSERMVMVVADMSSLMVRTRVLEADLRHIQLELPVKVKLDAYPDVEYNGFVKHVGGQGRTDTRAGYTYFDVDVSVEQHDPRVLPEMNATIELIFANRENVLTLPVAAVAIFPNKAVVHVRNASAPRGYDEKTIAVGLVNEADAEIVSGLSEGDEVLEIDFADLDIYPDDAGAVGKKKDKNKNSKKPKQS